MADTRDLMEQLRSVFSVADIEWKAGDRRENGTMAEALAYVTVRAVQERLDAVLGAGGWRVEFEEVIGGSVLIGVRARVWVKLDGEWLAKEDGSGSRMELGDRNMQVKGAYSDAMKRACVQWGVGRYLYALPEQVLPLTDTGEFKIPPKLPKAYVMESEWATYFGEKKADAEPTVAVAEVEEVGRAYELTTQLAVDGELYLVKGMTQAQVDKFNETVAKLKTVRLQSVLDWLKADEGARAAKVLGVAATAYLREKVAERIKSGTA